MFSYFTAILLDVLKHLRHINLNIAEHEHHN